MFVRLALSALILAALAACTSQHGSDVRAKPDSPVASAPGGDSAAIAARGGVDTAFRRLHIPVPFAGAYVNETYVDKILANRSPLLDQEVVDKSCIEIPDSTLKVTRWIYGFHEGGGNMMVVRNGDRYQLYEPDERKLDDTIETLSPGRLRIGKLVLRKLNYADLKKSDWGILEEILFGGKYQTPDGKVVVFGTDGTVSGLDTVAFYEPRIDYTGDVLGYDRIDLGSSPQRLISYACSFDKDTLLIYPIHCLDYDTVAKECAKEQLGAVRWRLRKVQ